MIAIEHSFIHNKNFEKFQALRNRAREHNAKKCYFYTCVQF